MRRKGIKNTTEEKVIFSIPMMEKLYLLW
jgi:hypothetical protein